MKKVLYALMMAVVMTFGISAGSADASSATAKTGTYKTKYNTNVRADAGTKYKIVTLAKKGTAVRITHQKKAGSQVWYKVRVNGKNGWILSTLLTKSKPAKKATVAAAKSGNTGVVNTAMKLRGIPYRFGGTTTRGFDCSGFTQYAFKKNGKSIARTTTAQYAQSKKVSSPKPGDLVFFHNTYRKGISHVGIYIGNNKFVHAGGKRSEVKSLSDRYWSSKFNSFRRI